MDGRLSILYKSPTIAVMLGIFLPPDYSGGRDVMDFLFSSFLSSLPAPMGKKERKSWANSSLVDPVYIIINISGKSLASPSPQELGLLSRFSRLMLGGRFHLYCISPTGSRYH
jgi:hypothetical protein